MNRIRELRDSWARAAPDRKSNASARHFPPVSRLKCLARVERSTPTPPRTATTATTTPIGRHSPSAPPKRARRARRVKHHARRASVHDTLAISSRAIVHDRRRRLRRSATANHGGPAITPARSILKSSHDSAIGRFEYVDRPGHDATRTDPRPTTPRKARTPPGPAKKYTFPSAC